MFKLFKVLLFFLHHHELPPLFLAQVQTECTPRAPWLVRALGKEHSPEDREHGTVTRGLGTLPDHRVHTAVSSYVKQILHSLKTIAHPQRMTITYKVLFKQFWYSISYNTLPQYATRDQWRNNSTKNEGMEPKQDHHPVLDVTGDRSKIQCCKEQYCIGTWNVRSMNQSKWQVVEQGMVKVNIDILGINELRWTGMDEFNSDDHYIYYCGQESLRRNGVDIIVN